MAPRRRCPVCGSRQWHKERSRGLIACSEGHVLQDYRNEATQTDTVDVRTLKKRALKSQREKDDVRSRANPDLYYGTRGRYLYFQCLQVLLRRQIATLIRLWELPAEFEIICRDMWALHLDLLPNPPIAEINENTQDAQDDNTMEDFARPEGGEADKNKKHTSESNISLSDEEREDPEMAALLRANSDLGNSSSEDNDSEGEADGSTENNGTRKTGEKRGLFPYETPASTIAILLITCWTMRIPALPRDLIKLIEAYELPYLDPVARQLLPESMIAHLNKHNVQALSPYNAPSAQGLHRLASRASRLIYSSHQISTPEANAAPILWRVVSQGLGGTPMLYRLTKRLGNILLLPLTLHDTLAPGLEKHKAYDPESQIYDNVAPEVGLIAAAIVVLKMVYGLDGRARTPKEPWNVACVFPGLDEYLVQLSLLEDETKKDVDMMFDSRSDICMGDVSEEMIDDYLRFCRRALIGKRDGDAVLERYFPLRGGDSHQNRDTHNGEVSLKYLGTMWEEESSKLRPGEGYRIYRGQDTEGKKTEELTVILGRAGRWTGVGIDYMGKVVETYERRLIRWVGKQPNNVTITE